MDNQEIFDKVVAHLRKQGGPSVGKDGRCKYRADNGRMCAVGCLIPDELYHKEMEGNAVLTGTVVDDVLEGMGVSSDGFELLSELQMLHDRNSGRSVLWTEVTENEFSEVAEKYYLRYSHE